MPIADAFVNGVAWRRHRLLATLFALMLTLPMMLARADIDYDKLAEHAASQYGPQAVQDVEDLTQLMAQLKTADEKTQLTKINLFFNQRIRRFDDDINIWGQSDYWATPLESLGRQRGDCEDYSIAKYLFLKHLIPDEKLRLTYVRAQIGGPYSKIFQAHMVLIYYETPTAEPLVLDNLISEIRPASRRKDLRPIFSFNSEGLWVGADKQDKGNSAAHLSRWSDVLRRAKADGID